LKDYDNYFSSIINIPIVYSNAAIKKDSLNILDDNVSGLGFKISVTDDGRGVLYRNDCLTKVAKWNYVGNIFYSKGLIIINNPLLYSSFDENFSCKFDSEAYVHVSEINIPLDIDTVNLSQNKTYSSLLRKSESDIDSEESFVYITEVNLHDENFNIVARSSIARPIAKSDSDRFLIRLRMDY
jgi:hypothetical protein